MVRASRARSRAEFAWRLLMPILVLALVLSVEAVAAPPAEAGGTSPGTALRQRQQQAEATMLRADRQIRRLQKQRQQHASRLNAAKRALEKAIARRDRARAKLERTGARLESARSTFARAVFVRPNPAGTQRLDKPNLRKQIRALEKKSRQLARQTRLLERKVERARKVKQSRWTKVSASRIRARKAARERAEDKLSAAISQMVTLSQQRADQRLTLASVRGFRAPARGTVSQRYGCTGYGSNPRRGGCRHFHDGVDIAARRGAPVRASADGYVAYVGRNPWDAGARAYVVIIGHARGYETIYGHLLPRRLVRAGQHVERGDLIGRVGSTGRSTGPHVHWEVSRGFRTIDPLRAGR